MSLLIFITLLIALIFSLRKAKELASDPHIDKDFFPNTHNEINKLDSSELPFTQLGGTINDASAINRTPVYGIVSVKTEEDIRRTLLYAKKHNLKISIAGAKHSMGRQAFAKDALILDMRGYKKMSVDKERKILFVQSGAIWHDVQVYLNPHHLSVLAMQSIDVPTVGGTIAVNAHGMDHRVGSIASTVKAIRFILANGSIIKLTRNQNEELFKAVIGGYGLLGIILDVELELMVNLTYVEKQKIINSNDFPQEFDQIIKNKNIHMFYARLSTAPSSFLEEMVLYTFETAQAKTNESIQLTSESYIKFRRFVLNLGRKNPVGREIKWLGEKYIQPLLQSNASSRNQIMHRSYAYLKNNIKNNTDVLQEYFLPREKVLPFIKELGKVLQKHQLVARNVELRCVYKEGLLLDYAHGDWFGVVLYLNFNVDEIEKVRVAHKELITIAQNLGGSFYLPYMLSASKEQVEKSYPKFQEFIKLKQKYDPNGLFTSGFYEHYK